MNAGLSEAPPEAVGLFDAACEFQRSAALGAALLPALRARIEAALAPTLVDIERLHEHIGRIRDLHGDAMPDYRLLTPKQVALAQAGGLAALDDAALAHLYLDPIALYNLRNWLTPAPPPRRPGPAAAKDALARARNRSRRPPAPRRPGEAQPSR